MQILLYNTNAFKDTNANLSYDANAPKDANANLSHDAGCKCKSIS